MLYLGCKIIIRRIARQPIVLHPKQKIVAELKWQTFWHDADQI